MASVGYVLHHLLNVPYWRKLWQGRLWFGKLKPSLYNYSSCHKQLVGKTLVNSKQIGKFAQVSLYSLGFSLYLCYSGIIHDAGHCYKALWPLSDSPCCCFTWWKMTLICSNVNNCSHMTSFMWENQKTKANSVWWLPEILVQRKP